jgi:hypothetical protein
MRLCTWSLLMSLLVIGCTARLDDPADDASTNEQGLTELRIDARALLAVGITQVTVAAGGQAQDLVLNPATGTYDGTMILPAGPQSLLAQAFSGATLVGASNPAAVTVQAGLVTHVVMHILDLTGSAPPLYGPILDSLVFPTTAQAMAPVTFAASVVAPAGDPVTYAWSSSCDDATFSAPASATTNWSKAAQGSCTITMIATSNGFSVAQSFEIVVFPPGSGSGAVDVSGLFVTAPSLFLAFPEVGCFISPGGNSSCAGSLASPNVSSYSVSVTSWGGSTPSALTLSDNCGGRFGTSYTSPESRSGFWMPPLGAGVCILTATAVNSDGLAATLTAAILVRAGTQATAQPPSIFGQLFPGPTCIFATGLPDPTDCGSIPAGTPMTLFGNISWADGYPDSVTLLDDCGGGLVPPSNAFNFGSPWNLPNLPGQLCTVTIRATNLQGGMSQASAQYHLQ